jgi:hypothetical protein
MAILAPLFALLGRFAGRVLTTTLGWAATLLFGRVRKDREAVIAAMTFGSIIWVALLLGVLVPDVGTFLLGFVPVPDWVDPNWVRLGMLVGAIVLPLTIGGASLIFIEESERPKGLDMAKQVLRGYPLTAALAVVLVFLAVVGTIRKLSVIARRWSDVHIPIVVHPGGYDRLVADLERALDDAGLEVVRDRAPAVMAMPGKLLAAAGGAGVRSLVPDELSMLKGKGLEVLIHPTDIAIAGTKTQMARARAAIASRLASTAASMTTSEEAQAIEHRLEKLARPEAPGGRPGAAAGPPEAGLDPDVVGELGSIDEALAKLEVPAEEWETLYRIRLQVERDLLAGHPVGEAFPGDEGAGIPLSRAKPSASSSEDDPIAVGAALAIAGLLALDAILVVLDRTRRRSS